MPSNASSSPSAAGRTPPSWRGVATDVLGAGRALCATAVSASLAPEELDDCAALAREWGLRWRAVPTDELADPSYVANDTDRCYHCKSTC